MDLQLSGAICKFLNARRLSVKVTGGAKKRGVLFTKVAKNSVVGQMVIWNRI